MSKKILVSAAVLAALAIPAGPSQAASILRTVGRHPVSAPLATVEDLRAMMRDMGGDIRTGMTTAGYPDLFPLVQAHIANYPQTQISMVEYLPGQQMDWMLFRRNGKGRVKVARDVTWGGNAPLQAFEFVVDRNGERYTFAVPLQCGNLALKEFGPAPVEVQTPVQVQIKEVPKEVIKYVDRPVEVVKYVDRPVEVVKTVPGPTVYVPKEVVKYVDKPVEVVKYVDKEVVREVQVPGPTRTVVKKVMVPGPTKTVYVDKPVVKEVVKVKEVKTEAKCCESPFRFIADGGYLYQKEDARYGFGRLGVEYVASPQFSFLALAGGAAKADGDAGEDAFMLDFMVQYNFFQCSSGGATWSPFFAGLGIGAWMTSGDDDVASENSGADIIAELGLRIFGTPAGTSAAIFLQGRSATDELDELEEYGRIGGGLRFRF